MKAFAKNVLVALGVAASILLVSTTPAKAQVVGHSADVAGYAGFVYVSNFANSICEGDPDCPVGNSHGIYGFNGGYNVTPHVAVIGEYSYVPLYSGEGVTLHTQIYGGGVRASLNPKSRVVGYGIFTVGGDRYSESEGSDSASASGYSLSFGGGASCFIGHHWGVRPEFRYMRMEYSGNGDTESFNSIAMTGGVFYQFGGHK